MKKHFFYLITAALALMLGLVSCGSEDNKKKDDASKQPPPVAGDVYVAGWGENDKSVLWKNGTQYNLEHPDKYAGAAAHSVFVSGSDVYVAGRYNGDAVVWKNGSLQSLNSTKDRYSEAKTVFVHGNDVYVVGYVDALRPAWYVDDDSQPRATLWKNGVLQRLSETSSIAHSVYVAAGNVYVAGVENISGNFADHRPVLWINGVLQRLSSNSGLFAGAMSVAASGGDVYVAGSEYISSRATLWVNGVPQSLESGYDARSVFLSGNDIYVAGVSLEGAYPLLWKNGISQQIGTTEGFAESVYVSGSDVYVAGYTSSNTGYTARLWKNGVSQSLANANMAGAYSVFVVK